MTDVIQWENGVISMPQDANFTATLDKAGEDSWEPWAVMGIDPTTQAIRIAVKRHKRKISLSTDINSALGK